MIKKYYLFFLIFFATQFVFSQCDNYSEIVTQNLKTVKFWDDQNGFAFGGAKLSLTNDGGNRWSDYELPDFATLFIEPLVACSIIDENSAIIVGHNGHILLTEDKGKSWNSKGLNYDGREGLCTVDFINSKIGYIAGFDYDRTKPIFYKTVDGGQNWKLVNSNLNVNDLEFTTIEFYEFKIHYVNENLGFLWKRNKLFKTTDGGLKWVKVSNPEIISNEPQIIVDINHTITDNRIILSTGINLYESTNDGLNWSTISQTVCSPGGPCLTSGEFDIKDNTLVTQIGNFNNNKIIVINLQDKTTKTFDIENDIGYITGINIYDDNKIVFTGTGFNYSNFGRKIVRTIDGGNTFETLDSFNAKNLSSKSNNNLTIFRNDENILTAAISDDYKNYSWDAFGFFIHISKDDGNSWRQIVKEETNSGKLLNANKEYISYVKYTNGMNSSEGFTLRESHDYGQNWTEEKLFFPQNTEPSVINLSSLDVNTFLFKNYSDYYYSIDKGKNWLKVNLPYIDSGTFYSFNFKSLNEIYAWGQKNNWPSDYDYFLFKSTDIGKTWNQVVSIPDNNGNDLGVFATTTYFGSNFAIVSTGGNSYYKVDLINNSFNSIPFKHPNNKSVYLMDNEMFMINDNTWVISTGSVGYSLLATSYDQGANWEYRFCTLCGNNFVYNQNKDELLTYSRDDLKIGKLKSYIPKEPLILGPTNAKLNSIEEYFLPYDVYISETKWELSSGGEIIYFADDQKGYYKIKVKWVTNGEHTLRVTRINGCGESEPNMIKIKVGSLGLNETESDLKVVIYPNPFTDKIIIKSNKEVSELEKIELYNITGSKVFIYAEKNKSEEIVLNNLGYLSTGVYFLKIKVAGRNEIIKLIKD